MHDSSVSCRFQRKRRDRREGRACAAADYHDHPRWLLVSVFHHLQIRPAGKWSQIRTLGRL